MESFLALKNEYIPVEIYEVITKLSEEKPFEILIKETQNTWNSAEYFPTEFNIE